MSNSRDFRDSKPFQIILEGLKISDLDQLRTIPDSRLLRLSNFGRKSLQFVRSKYPFDEEAVFSELTRAIKEGRRLNDDQRREVVRKVHRSKSAISAVLLQLGL